MITSQDRRQIVKRQSVLGKLRRIIDGFEGKQELLLYAVGIISIAFLIGNGLSNEIADYNNSHPQTVKSISHATVPSPTPVSVIVLSPTSVVSPRKIGVTGVTNFTTPTITRIPTIFTPHEVTVTPTPIPSSHAVVQSVSTTNHAVTDTPTPSKFSPVVTLSSPTPIAGQSAQSCLVSLNNSCAFVLENNLHIPEIK